VPRKSAHEPAAEGSGSKSARTRERILDAAAHVLSRKGYAGTRLADVADHAGLQAPAIYYHFPSRDDLIAEVMGTGIARLNDHIDRILAELPAGTDPLGRIDAAVEGHLRYQLEISDYAAAAIRNAGQIPEHIGVRSGAGISKYGDLWRALVQDAAQAGLLRSDVDPAVARMLVLGALNWTAEWWNPRRGSLGTVIRTAQSLVRHGLEVSRAGPEPRPAMRRRAGQTARAAG
jgi:TetR/AcrR family transcriptional regulator, cholesterol catabolism regulator